MRIAMRVAGRRQCRAPCDTVPALDGARHLLSLPSKEAQAMSELKNQTRYSGVDRRAPRPDPGVLKPRAAPRDHYKTGGRHPAVTHNLYKLHNHQNRAQKNCGSPEEKKKNTPRQRLTSLTKPHTGFS